MRFISCNVVSNREDRYYYNKNCDRLINLMSAAAYFPSYAKKIFQTIKLKVEVECVMCDAMENARWKSFEMLLGLGMIECLSKRLLNT